MGAVGKDLSSVRREAFESLVSCWLGLYAGLGLDYTLLIVAFYEGSSDYTNHHAEHNLKTERASKLGKTVCG